MALVMTLIAACQTAPVVDIHRIEALETKVAEIETQLQDQAAVLASLADSNEAILARIAEIEAETGETAVPVDFTLYMDDRVMNEGAMKAYMYRIGDMLYGWIVVDAWTKVNEGDVLYVVPDVTPSHANAITTGGGMAFMAKYGNHFPIYPQWTTNGPGAWAIRFFLTNDAVNGPFGVKLVGKRMSLPGGYQWVMGERDAFYFYLGGDLR
jgi:hypothetical protein